MRSALPLFLLVLVASACGAPGSDPAEAGLVVRDSAGIRVVENLAPAWGEGEGWTLSPEPALEIGVAEGEPPYMFGRIQGLVRLGDGAIVAIDGASTELRAFDGRGRHLWSAGRAGDGPGEFRFPQQLLRGVGDTLIVWDGALRRASVFSPGGVYVRDFRVSDLPGGLPFAELQGVFPDGTLLAAGPRPSQPRMEAAPGGSAGWWDPAVLLRLTADGGEAREIGVGYGPLCGSPRGECSFVAYGGSGGFALAGNRIYQGWPDRNEFVVWREGGVEMIVRGSAPLLPVTPAMEDEFAEAVVAGNPGRAGALRDYMAQATFADVVPAFMGFLVSPDGYVWTREYRVEVAPFGYPPSFPPRLDPWKFVVYDPEGVELGVVEVPFEVSVREVGSDYLLGVSRDDLRVERIVVYEILKP